jgi:hypothetical protein
MVRNIRMGEHVSGSRHQVCKRGHDLLDGISSNGVVEAAHEERKET